MQFNKKLSDMSKDREYKYLLVNVIAKRARELNDGARPELPLSADNPLDLTRVSSAELADDKLRVEPSQRAGQLVDIAGVVK